jgi:hypothetical protein
MSKWQRKEDTIIESLLTARGNKKRWLAIVADCKELGKLSLAMEWERKAEGAQKEEERLSLVLETMGIVPPPEHAF